MTNFFAALLALMANFVQPANPDLLPPTVNATEFENRGRQVSELAKSLNPPNHDEVGNSQNVSGNSSANNSFNGFHGLNPRRQNSGATGASGATGPTGPTGNSGPNTNRVPAENIRSGITMPHNIPQVALDHSPALQGSSSGFPLPPGQNNGNN